MEVDSIPQETQKKMEEIANADLVVGILTDLDQEGIAKVSDALATLSGSPRVALLQNDDSSNPDHGKHATSDKNTSIVVIPWPQLRPLTPDTPVLSVFTAYRTVFAASEKLGAKACCILASKLETATPRWVFQLAQPLLENNVDLVVPRYASRKYEGLLNRSIISPLVRCLYGKRIHNPMGPDLGISRRLFQKVAGAEANSRPSDPHPLASLAPTALADNLGVCEVHVGSRTYSPTDWSNVSSVLAEILGPVFNDMQRNVAYWQRMRGSVPLPSFGEPVIVSQDAGPLDVSRMIESFHLANRDLEEIWSLVLPPASLFELRKIARLPVEQFRMPDELWVRIIFDFALAYRLRTINRDHLLKSMTPLYLAWVASYAHDLETTGAADPEQRLDRLSVAYESDKSYLVSRWRWPDRFNP